MDSWIAHEESFHVKSVSGAGDLQPACAPPLKSADPDIIRDASQSGLRVSRTPVQERQTSCEDACPDAGSEGYLTNSSLFLTSLEDWLEGRLGGNVVGIFENLAPMIGTIIENLAPMIGTIIGKAKNVFVQCPLGVGPETDVFSSLGKAGRGMMPRPALFLRGLHENN